MLTRHPFPSGRRGCLDEKNMHVFVCMHVCLFDDHIWYNSPHVTCDYL